MLYIPKSAFMKVVAQRVATDCVGRLVCPSFREQGRVVAIHNQRSEVDHGGNGSVRIKDRHSRTADAPAASR
jgi:hypothetical protein